MPHGTHTDFWRAVAARDDETVFLGCATFSSRAHGQEVVARVMVDPRMAAARELPFDGKRMFWGGFQVRLG